MARIVVEVSGVAVRRRRTTTACSSLPVAAWLSLRGTWGAALELPIGRLVLRRLVSGDGGADGVRWEVGVFPACGKQPIEKGAEAMINKAILVGNLGGDPVLRSTTSGTPAASFSLATHHRWRDRDGNRQEATEWHNVVCFGRQAEVARQYLRQGRQVYVEGRIQTRSWEDRQTGQVRFRTEIVCRGFQMLGSATEQALAAKVDEEEPPAAGDAPEPEDDDIPF